MVTGVDQTGLRVVKYPLPNMQLQADSLMNHALTNWIAHAESMTVTVLILLVAVVKGMQHLLRRLSKSRLTLQTDSFNLTLQTKQGLSPQELQQHRQQGDDKDGNSNNDDGRVHESPKRPDF